MIPITRNQTAKMFQQQSTSKFPEHNTLLNTKKSHILTKQLILNLALNVKNSYIDNPYNEDTLVSEPSSSNTQDQEQDIYVEIIDPNLKPIDLTDNVSQTSDNFDNNNKQLVTNNN